MGDELATSIDTSRPPVGELAARRLVDALVQTDDRAERHYLEVKSDVDLTRTLGAAKVAKFILGAANRLPDLANRAFGGYAVMVIGVEAGGTPGVPPIEVGDIEMRVRPFLSAAGPSWDVIHVPVASDRDVLLIVVDPPQSGQAPFLCWKDFSADQKGDARHGLRDGAIYVRSEGATRPATAEETIALLERARDARPEVDLAVMVQGTAFRSARDPGLLGEHIESVVSNLLAKLPAEDSSSRAPLASLSELAAFSQLRNEIAKSSLIDSITGGTRPESRTREHYIGEVERWAQSASQAMAAFLDEIVAGVGTPVIIQVVNRARTYFEDAELTVHLEGDVVGLEPREEKLSLRAWPPRSPRPYGPEQMRDPLMAGHSFAVPYVSPIRPYAPPSFIWENGGSITVTWSIGDLRPRETVDADSDDTFVLVVRDLELQSVRGTWSLTARGHHDVYEGEIAVPIADAPDVTDEVVSFLNRRR